MHPESTTHPSSSQPSLKPTVAQVVARMLLRRDVRAIAQEHDYDVTARSETLFSVQGETDAANLVASLRIAFEPLLLEAFEAGRLSVLGDLSERVNEHPQPSCLPPSGLVVHDICESCGGTLIGPWDKRDVTLELGRADGWRDGCCGECDVTRMAGTEMMPATDGDVSDAAAEMR